MTYYVPNILKSNMQEMFNIVCHSNTDHIFFENFLLPVIVKWKKMSNACWTSTTLRSLVSTDWVLSTNIFQRMNLYAENPASSKVKAFDTQKHCIIVIYLNTYMCFYWSCILDYIIYYLAMCQSTFRCFDNNLILTKLFIFLCI